MVSTELTYTGKTAFFREFRGTLDLKKATGTMKSMRLGGPSMRTGAYKCLLLPPVPHLRIHERERGEEANTVQGMPERWEQHQR